MNDNTTLGRPIISCYSDTDLVHAAYAVTGLIELADANEIELRFHLFDRELDQDRKVWTLWMRIDFGNEVQRGVCLDFHDAPEYFCLTSLRACHFYFKSNLNHRTFEMVPVELRDKLRPFGPYFPCRPAHDRNLTLRRIGSLYAKLRHRFFQAEGPSSFFSKLRQVAPELLRYRRYLSRKTRIEYEHPPINEPTALPYAVVFNPTCWDEIDEPWVRPMNQFRSQLIAELRESFGNRFIGGFRRSETAVKYYADALERESLTHDEFLLRCNTTPVSIYSNGKADCFSWRLAEAFAASKCIVSEQIPNDAGRHLNESVGCLQATDIPNMIATLRRLDSDPAMVVEYSRRAHQFYLDYLHPTARIRNLLREVSAHSKSVESGPQEVFATSDEQPNRATLLAVAEHY